ncbi:phosphopantetheine-binding protein [Chitiniphilus purpureus]|uniref:Phosphopantetheine-binding protein n=1 Tax=Chitiniphilus purpureus TaxID=2981137 RepID=A0ABY6DR04_9NEIS|nr:phosphopantetheine-binding protein [Chitiniphilus sp. CD1]UXY16148.1 phosphopantetheine-binding protein [Chitiniphilus sp. CD1]
MSAQIKEVIENVIRSVATERDLPLPALTGATEIVDELGFSSLLVATLIANLEEALGVDPFQDEDVMITDIRTIQDLCDVYAQSLRRVH